MTGPSLAPLPPRAEPGRCPPLVDGFGRRHDYLRLSLTERCNLRCRYCMPAEGIPIRSRAHLLTFEEIERLVRLMAAMGVNRVRLTGGEPTLRRDLPDLVATLGGIPGIDNIGMTTNGLLLDRLARPLREAGLARLNVSLDSLRPDRFEQITRSRGLDGVLRGLDAAIAAGFPRLRINTVIIGGVNDDEIFDFVELMRERPLNVRFIEYMPFSGNGWTSARMVPWRDLLTRLRGRYSLTPLDSGDPHAVAREYSVDEIGGTVGFIGSLSDPFCGGCNRIRVTADGLIRNCLFQTNGCSLRDAMRAGADDRDLEDLIRGIIARKWKEHPPAEELEAQAAGVMTHIGG